MRSKSEVLFVSSELIIVNQFDTDTFEIRPLWNVELPECSLSSFEVFAVYYVSFILIIAIFAVYEFDLCLELLLSI